MHANWIHLLGNIWIFGNNIEDRFGHLLFLVLYFLGGIVASLCHWSMVSDAESLVPVVGASGSVAVILGAYAVAYPTHYIRCVLVICIPLFLRLPALAVPGIWIAGQLVSASSATRLGIGGNVAWWAHVGGFVTGTLVTPVLDALIPPPRCNSQPSAGEFRFMRDAQRPRDD